MHITSSGLSFNSTPLIKSDLQVPVKTSRTSLSYQGTALPQKPGYFSEKMLSMSIYLHANSPGHMEGHQVRKLLAECKTHGLFEEFRNAWILVLRSRCMQSDMPHVLASALVDQLEIEEIQEKEELNELIKHCLFSYTPNTLIIDKLVSSHSKKLTNYLEIECKIMNTCESIISQRYYPQTTDAYLSIEPVPLALLSSHLLSYVLCHENTAMVNDTIKGLAEEDLREFTNEQLSVIVESLSELQLMELIVIQAPHMSQREIEAFTPSRVFKALSESFKDEIDLIGESLINLEISCSNISHSDVVNLQAIETLLRAFLRYSRAIDKTNGTFTTELLILLSIPIASWQTRITELESRLDAYLSKIHPDLMTAMSAAQGTVCFQSSDLPEPSLVGLYPDWQQAPLEAILAQLASSNSSESENTRLFDSLVENIARGRLIEGDAYHASNNPQYPTWDEHPISPYSTEQLLGQSQKPIMDQLISALQSNKSLLPVFAKTPDGNVPQSLLKAFHEGLISHDQFVSALIAYEYWADFHKEADIEYFDLQSSTGLDKLNNLLPANALYNFSGAKQWLEKVANLLETEPQSESSFYILSDTNHSTEFSMMHKRLKEVSSGKRIPFAPFDLEDGTTVAVIPSFSMAKSMLTALTGDNAVTPLPKLGSSSMQDVHRGMAKHSHELGLYMPGVPLPQKADGHLLDSNGSGFTAHDFYHCWINSGIQSQLRKNVINFAEACIEDRSRIFQSGLDPETVIWDLIDFEGAALTGSNKLIELLSPSFSKAKYLPRSLLMTIINEIRNGPQGPTAEVAFREYVSENLDLPR